MSRPTRDEVDRELAIHKNGLRQTTPGERLLAAEVRALRLDLEWQVAATKALQVSQEQLARAIVRVESLCETYELNPNIKVDCQSMAHDIRVVLKGGE